MVRMTPAQFFLIVKNVEHLGEAVNIVGRSIGLEHRTRPNTGCCPHHLHAFA